MKELFSKLAQQLIESGSRIPMKVGRKFTFASKEYKIKVDPRKR